MIRSFESGHNGKQVGLVLAVLVALALIIWAVAHGFHGRQIDSGARALVKASETPTQPVLPIKP